MRSNSRRSAGTCKDDIENHEKTSYLGKIQNRPRCKSVPKTLFWSSQTVVQESDKILNEANEPISSHVPLMKLRHEPYTLPEGYEWSEIKILDPKQLDELWEFLNENYSEDSNNNFRLTFSKNYLLWALTPSYWNSQLHVSIRCSKTKVIIGFLALLPNLFNIKGVIIQSYMSTFLCVQKSMRRRRIAPTLIKEIIRRGRLLSVYTCLFSSTRELYLPFVTTIYWNRVLNVDKLMNYGYVDLKKGMTLSFYKKINELPDNPQTIGFRPMQKSDMSQVCVLLQSHQSKFKFSKVFTENEIYNMFYPRDTVISSYVVENMSTVTDFVSFTHSSVICLKEEGQNIKTAYLNYYACHKTPIETLIGDALISASNDGFDLFVATDLMENDNFFNKCKFKESCVQQNYYLFNWRCSPFKKNEVSLALP